MCHVSTHFLVLAADRRLWWIHGMDREFSPFHATRELGFAFVIWQHFPHK
jgi:hypothetical protein